MGRKPKDYTGEIHGCWEVIGRDFNPKSKSHETFWLSKCLKCGNIASVRKSDLDKNPNSCNNCKGDIIRSYKIGDKYGYLTIVDRGISKGNHTYVKVQCDCGSGPFNVRLEHLKGQNHGKTISCGCASESAGELKIRQELEKWNIIFKTQYRIKEFNINSPFDFAIFDKNEKLLALIEYDGEQHFKVVDFFGGEEKFLQQKENDEKKNKWCKENNIKLVRIPCSEYDNITIKNILLAISN